MSRRAQSGAHSGVGEPASLSDVALKKAERASLMVCILGNLGKPAICKNISPLAEQRLEFSNENVYFC